MTKVFGTAKCYCCFSILCILFRQVNEKKFLAQPYIIAVLQHHRRGYKQKVKQIVDLQESGIDVTQPR